LGTPAQHRAIPWKPDARQRHGKQLLASASGAHPTHSEVQSEQAHERVTARVGDADQAIDLVGVAVAWRTDPAYSYAAPVMGVMTALEGNDVDHLVGHEVKNFDNAVITTDWDLRND
jgi:hypothetical protein